MNSFDILVIILSIFLAIFLVVSIIACIKIIQLLNYLRSVSKKAENIASKIESVSDSLSRHARSTVVLDAISSAIKGFATNKGRRK